MKEEQKIRKRKGRSKGKEKTEQKVEEKVGKRKGWTKRRRTKIEDEKARKMRRKGGE